MKANLKGLGGIKHLLLAHGEKLGILVVAICAAMLIYQSLLRDRLPADKQADRLNQRITLARQDMDNYTWPKMKTEHPEDIREFKPLEQKADLTVDQTAYVGPHSHIGWDRAVVPPIVLRPDPVLLDAQDVEVRGGSGLLAFADPEVKKRKILEEQMKAAQLSNKQKKEMEKQQEDANRGGARSRGRTGQEGDSMANVYDPEHPKRKPVLGMVRPAGVPLQDYEEVRVAHWAIVVAKVPIKEQLQLYRSAFENARDYNPAADVPQYLGYFVERAEVQPTDSDKDLNWQRVKVYDGKSTIPIAPVVSLDALYGKPEDLVAKKRAVKGVVTDWAMQMPEIVDPRYLGEGTLAFPLPPLVGRDWGSEVTHSEIPLAADAVELTEEDTNSDATDAPAPASAEPADFFSGGPSAGAGGIGRPSMMGSALGGRGYGGEMGGRGYGGGMEGRGYGMEGGAYGGGMGGRGYGMEGGRGTSYAGAGGGGLGQNGELQAPCWLLRFFDFSVEPGKKYKYRVQLAMLDPNQSSGTRYVSPDSLNPEADKRIRQEKAARKSRSTPFRLTEWSKPSVTVSIPLAGSVKVASTKPATDKFNDEPSATLLVESFGSDEKGNAIQVAEEESFHRGNVANMTKDTKLLVEGGRAYDPVSKFPFRTGITVADIRGGERLTRKELRPARVLLMGPAGQLFVQDELEDADAIEMHEAAFSEESTSGAGGFMGGFEGRGGFPGRGR
jgi:hypothetical protein